MKRLSYEINRQRGGQYIKVGSSSGHRNDDDGSDGDDAKGTKNLGYGAADGRIAKSAKSAVGCSCQHWMHSPMLDTLSGAGCALQ